MATLLDKCLPYKARYEDEKRIRLAYTDLCQQYEATQQQMSEQVEALQREKLVLAERLDLLQEQHKNLTAYAADQEEEIARLKHKKKPSRTTAL